MIWNCTACAAQPKSVILGLLVANQTFLAVDSFWFVYITSRVLETDALLQLRIPCSIQVVRATLPLECWSIGASAGSSFARQDGVRPVTLRTGGACLACHSKIVIFNRPIKEHEKRVPSNGAGGGRHWGACGMN